MKEKNVSKNHGKNRTANAFLVIVLLIIVLFAINFVFKELLPDIRENAENDSDSAAEVVIDDDRIAIVDYSFDDGEFFSGDIINSTLIFANNSIDDHIFWVGCSVRDPLGEWYDIPAIEFTLEKREEATADFSWTVPEGKLINGHYLITMAVWSDIPGTESAVRLATVQREEAFLVFNYYEDFSVFNEEIWEKSEHALGSGQLEPENVVVEDGLLKLIMPANTLNGGQLETKANNHLYGSYRASIKLPDAPSSITGFFLYAPPDYYHEVDIEVFNDSSGEIWFTTYAGGKESNKHEAELEFDPTADFHEYRFDFYPGKISFYVDNRLITSFEGGLTDTPMQFMINSWFPVWLDNLEPVEDAVTLIEWIKY